jgi:hypothetical protein
MRLQTADSLLGLQDRLCKGDAYSPAPGLGMRFGGRRDFTFGICECFNPTPMRFQPHHLSVGRWLGKQQLIADQQATA